MTGREAAEAIIRRLRGAGRVALLAGGCVRDLLLDREPKDYDVATDATPGQVVSLFRRTEQVGAKFGVVIVRLGGQVIEVATFRSDGDYQDGRHPRKVTFSSPEQDAQRRDFTINGMFYDPAAARVLDFVGGMEDLRRGVVRAIGDPERRFNEDHLRMLRAVRFAARFDFRIDPDTLAAMRAAAHRIRSISAERIRVELVMILTEPTRRRGWELIHESGLSAWLVPDTTWSDDASTLTAARLGALPVECSERLAWALLLRDHPPAGVAHRCRRLTCSNRVARDAAWLVEQVPRLLECEVFQPADFKLLLADPCGPELDPLLEAETRARHLPEAPLSRWRRAVAEIPPEQIAPPRMVTGDDLLALGLPPGPAFASLLAELYRRQLNGCFATREAAVRAARAMVAAERSR